MKRYLKYLKLCLGMVLLWVFHLSILLYYFFSVLSLSKIYRHWYITSNFLLVLSIFVSSLRVINTQLTIVYSCLCFVSINRGLMTKPIGFLRVPPLKFVEQILQGSGNNSSIQRHIKKMSKNSLIVGRLHCFSKQSL